jgi:hypothetical protein
VKGTTNALGPRPGFSGMCSLGRRLQAMGSVFRHPALPPTPQMSSRFNPHRGYTVTCTNRAQNATPAPMLACTPADSHANFPELDRGLDQSPSVDVLAMPVAADGASDIVEAAEVVKAARNNISRGWQQCTCTMYLTRQLVSPCIWKYWLEPPGQRFNHISPWDRKSVAII